jgi:hypothetical protein
MDKKWIALLILACFVILSPSAAYPSWTEYKKIRYIDLDGDSADEIIIEARHGAGIGHYIEDMRIFKDKYPKLELVFSIRTLDSYFVDRNYNYDIVSEVKFSEPAIQNKGARDIIVHSGKVVYKDDEHKLIEREEKAADKIYKWNGVAFVEQKR